MRKNFGWLWLVVLLASACRQTPFVTRFTATPGPYPIRPVWPPSTSYPAPVETLPPAPINSPVPVSSSTPPPAPPFFPSPIPPNIISKNSLDCPQQGPVRQCQDQILQIGFEYPATWGTIEATLSTGDTGLAYDYLFSALLLEQGPIVLAGGRSSDFTQGRGGIFTDFDGDGPAQNKCATVRTGVLVCEDIQPNVVLYLLYSPAQSLCDPAPGVVTAPTAFIEVNLPDNPTVTGFRFVQHAFSKTLTDILSANRQEVLGYDPLTGPTQCDSAHQSELDQRTAQLFAAIANQTADPETLAKVEQLRQVAASIEFQPQP